MEDVIYKGDTSADELIGHMFLYKLAYDILGEEDPELRELIVNAVDRIAYHLASNGYINSGGNISFHNPTSMEASTQYTLPYWLGRYHGMLSPT